MISIKNSQRKIAVNTKKLHADAQIILDALNYGDFDLGIWLTTNKTIRFYNREYRHKDKPTDILSFGYHTELKPGERIKPKSDDDKNLGDLIISVEYTLADAQRMGITLEQRLEVLLVHGICHLQGYDHETEEEYKVMHRKELALLKKIRNAHVQ